VKGYLRQQPVLRHQLCDVSGQDDVPAIASRRQALMGSAVAQLTVMGRSAPVLIDLRAEQAHGQAGADTEKLGRGSAMEGTTCIMMCTLPQTSS